MEGWREPQSASRREGPPLSHCVCVCVCVRMRVRVLICTHACTIFTTAGFAARLESTVDAVAASADISCVLVYVHPFACLRAHRCVSVQLATASHISISSLAHFSPLSRSLAPPRPLRAEPERVCCKC